MNTTNRSACIVTAQKEKLWGSKAWWENGLINLQPEGSFLQPFADCTVCNKALSVVIPFLCRIFIQLPTAPAFMPLVQWIVLYEPNMCVIYCYDQGSKLWSKNDFPDPFTDKQTTCWNNQWFILYLQHRK